MSVLVNEREIKERFESCFKQSFKSLCFHAMSYVGNEDVAKDIVHDVFLYVWKRRVDIDFSQPIYLYLLGLTRNRSLNYLDHQKIKFRYEERELQAGELYTTAQNTEHEELIQRIIERIDQLPERCKEVMYLCFIEDKKYKEIAEMLSISVNTVKTHVTTGLKILRDEFPASLLLLFFLKRKFF